MFGFLQSEIDKSGWLPEYRFFLLNGNVNCEIRKLCDTLTANFLTAWIPGGILVVDESMWEFLGSSPCHAFIPRKPHPNGLLCYTMAQYTAKMRIPITLGVEPWIPLNKLSPRDSARVLLKKLLAKHDFDSKLHFIADSAFGSYADAEEYVKMGVYVTFSMTETPKEWLYQLLLHQATIDSGRVAIVPFASSLDGVLASSLRVKTENDKIVDIRTITTSFEWSAPAETEWTVARIGARRASQERRFEYETLWASGETTWEPAYSFMSDDGTFNTDWLEMAHEEDIRDAVGDLTQADLVAICDTKSWKVDCICRCVTTSNHSF